MKDSKNVIFTDLNYICKNTEIELLELSGNRLLITGGAGFLGYYLVKTILHWNNKNNHKPPIELVVYDNFMRGVPKWLDSLYKRENINIEKPLPESHYRVMVHYWHRQTRIQLYLAVVLLVV